ncbi:MAG: hypothetical protein EZS28_025739, partial [Streblomastix strix]
EDDYDYYESQAAKIRQNEITSKTVWQAAVSAINDSKTRKYGDDLIATPDNLVVYDKKRNAIYSVDGYTTAPHKERERKLHSFRAFTADAKNFINTNGGATLPMATEQQIMASVWKTVFITPVVDILERLDGKIDIYNRSNKVNIQKGDYEYLPLAKRLYKKELPAVIAQLYNDNPFGNRIAQAVAQAMQYYCQILTQRQQNINVVQLATAFYKSFLLGTLRTLGTLGTLGTLKRYSLSNPFSRADYMHLLAYWHIGSQFLQQVKNALLMKDKQRYDSQKRRTPPIAPPNTPQIQALPEWQPHNQSPRQTQPQLTQIQDYNYHLNCNPNKAKLPMCGWIIK